MGNKVAFLFSGQGSQYPRMAEPLWQSKERFRKTFRRLDKINIELQGFSIEEGLYRASREKTERLLSQTRFSHPAIFMVEYALMKLLEEGDIVPDVVLGASLGEFCASVAAGVLTEEDALQWVIFQAQAVEQFAHQGGMLAVLTTPATFDDHPELFEGTTLVGVNFNRHFVLSGSMEAVRKSHEFLRAQEITATLLPVSHPFHSTLIDPAREPFLRRLSSELLNCPRIPWITCLTGSEIQAVETPHFWNVVSQPILYQNGLQQIIQRGVDVIVDLGPSGTLATFAKYNGVNEKKIKLHQIINPFGEDLKKLDQLNFMG